MPVRQPRRRGHRAAARRRHAVPDDVLPDLPAGGLEDRHARGLRADARDDRAARQDEELAAAYRGAHEAYLAARAAIGEVPEIAGISAGGMPDRVKCLHVLAGQSLAQGRGVNPLGDEVLDELGDWWARAPASPRGRERTMTASLPSTAAPTRCAC